MKRTETDFIGSKEIPCEALYGLQSVRAKENFPDRRPFHPEWYQAMGVVKEACYVSYQKFIAAADAKFDLKQLHIRQIQPEILDKLIETAAEVSNGQYFDHFIIPGISGGAGTSINMNVNEVIANASLKKLGFQPGEYAKINPLDDVNIYQSTNDVVPTALRVAAMKLLNSLEESINWLRFKMEELEKEYRQDLRIGYTQMQEAVPTTFGRLFSTYSQALSRDWWRISKCFERIKVINLGGSALGTGLTVPRFMIMEVVTELQQLTGLPLSRGENLSDVTSNLDVFVEVHAVLKAHAVNLEKMSSDLRLLAADFRVNKELNLPAMQIGSTIMPGKVNPVIAEFVISSAHQVYANDQTITSLSAQGCLELNAYLPLIGHALLDSIKLLIAADTTLLENLLNGLTVNRTTAAERVLCSPGIATALLPLIGYQQSAELAKVMRQENCSILEANRQLQAIPEEQLQKWIQADNLLKLGFSLSELN